MGNCKIESALFRVTLLLCRLPSGCAQNQIMIMKTSPIYLCEECRKIIVWGHLTYFLPTIIFGCEEQLTVRVIKKNSNEIQHSAIE